MDIISSIRSVTASETKAKLLENFEIVKFNIEIKGQIYGGFSPIRRRT